MKRGGRYIGKREIFKAALVFYLIALLIFTFFPRPVLETGDPSAIADYLRSHANYFYKILYADTRIVELGNFFMLTPLIVVANGAFPELKLRALFAVCVFLSALIELSQRVIPGRISDPLDLAANSVSVLLGNFLVRLLQLFSRF